MCVVIVISAIVYIWKISKPDARGYRIYQSKWSIPQKLTQLKEKSTLGHPKSKLRPGYGMNFQYRGQILNGLNRYWVIAGLMIPTVDWEGMNMDYSAFKYNSTKVSIIPNAATDEMKAICKIIENKIGHAAQEE